MKWEIVAHGREDVENDWKLNLFNGFGIQIKWKHH
jgi:hypothetical protein